MILAYNEQCLVISYSGISIAYTSTELFSLIISISYTVFYILYRYNKSKLYLETSFSDTKNTVETLQMLITPFFLI